MKTAIILGIILLSAFVNFIIGFLVYSRREKNKKLYIWFSIMAYIIAFASFLAFFSRLFENTFLYRMLLACIPLFIYSLILWLNYFLWNKVTRITKILGFFAGVASFLTFLPGFAERIYMVSKLTFKYESGPLFCLFGMLFGILFIYFIYILIYGYRVSCAIKRSQLHLVGGGLFLVGVCVVPILIIGPFFGFYEGSVFIVPLFFIFVVTSAYAIYKHHLFNIKVITTEIFTFLIWLFLLVRTLVSNGIEEIIINGGLLAFLFVFGILLIKSVTKEVQQREEIEKLAHRLKGANAKLKEMDKTKSEFISIASHQLRTPLTVIKGYISMILDNDLGVYSKRIRKALSKVAVSNERLISLVNELLNLSRMERGKMEYNFKPVDLSNIVESVLEELSTVLKEKNLYCKFNKKQKNIPKVLADEAKIREVIMNLFDNAIKYTDKGGIIFALEKFGDKVKFSIKDTGIGFNKEDKKKLFKRFSRIVSTQTAGTGIGLYVVKTIIKAHKGKIFADSQGRGKGSTFGFILKSVKKK